ncbi:hypothetical protein Pla86_20390 [Planctomycetes bacterium Pla86]|uniref:Uncharacterized protein n=1 Tax=Engelhardtia mirabilis TaxID=2528011 RepID=A0A518BJ16_9BACT|nr:hypothetical protein Pla133_20380 [Planctomycetes bacterium Pla133]QDV01290.1 hypothetical protein Pla86_20390 [Planctomycetes bacterium Pla86]
MTNEGKSDTEKWIKDKGATYPYAYFKGSDLQKFAEMKGWPHAILINPEGRVVWAGHPGNLGGSIIEQNLDGALPVPLFDFPKKASKIKKAIQDRELAVALAEAKEYEAAGEELAVEIRSAVETLISSRVDSLKKAHEKGDFMTLVDRGPDLVKSLDDLPQAAEIQALLDQVDEDDDAQEVVSAQRAIAKMREGLEKLKKKKEVDKLVEKLEQLSEEFSGSFAAEQARDLMAELTQLRPQLK